MNADITLFGEEAPQSVIHDRPYCRSMTDSKLNKENENNNKIEENKMSEEVEVPVQEPLFDQDADQPYSPQSSTSN